MADGTISFADGLGSKALDSDEIRRKLRVTGASLTSDSTASPSNLDSQLENPNLLRSSSDFPACSHSQLVINCPHAGRLSDTEQKAASHEWIQVGNGKPKTIPCDSVAAPSSPHHNTVSNDPTVIQVEECSESEGKMLKILGELHTLLANLLTVRSDAISAQLDAAVVQVQIAVVLAVVTGCCY
ncbi:hypothetical protein RHMOL_Rhmol08G0112500 [Rhododendron molle]|uniref:Uncharacterized protein n=1 Tax=Rhododendron molle TaxID=49168 RepID=A0ACC0MP79_RHOML|nr:hypothetical protein RHMOL_Rhmol08G0112500 [Rhododendron molle]